MMYDERRPIPTSAACRSAGLALFTLAAAAIIFTEYRITQTAAFRGSAQLLPLAVTVDMVLGIPLLFYWLVVRKFNGSPLTCVGMAVLAVWLASRVLPTSQQQYLRGFELLLALAELGLLGLVLVKIRQVIGVYRLEATVRVDFIRNLEISLKETLWFPTSWLVSELAMLRYGLLGWLGGPECELGQRVFTLHRQSGAVALLGVVAVVSVIEALALHLLVYPRWPALAWGLLFLSAYTFVFLLALATSLVKRPVILADEALILRVGLVWRVEIPLMNIQSAVTQGRDPEASVLNLARAMLTPPNVWLTVHEPVIVQGLYGRQRVVRTLALFVDEPHELVAALSGD